MKHIILSENLAISTATIRGAIKTVVRQWMRSSNNITRLISTVFIRQSVLLVQQLQKINY